jgi:hypothetical protein
MPIDLSNLSADDIAAATAVKAAREAREERERREVEERRKWQEEERACQEATMRREAEERKVAVAQKAEAERRDRLAREKAAWEEAAGGTEVVPLVVADVEWVRTPLFLMDSDLPVLKLLWRLARIARRNQGVAAGARAVMMRRTMTGPSGLWMGMQWLSKYRAVFLFTMPFSSLLLSFSFFSFCY